MMASRWLVAGVATALMACVEPTEDPDDGEDRDIVASPFTSDQCTVVNHGPGIDDGLVGICHACDGGYEYLRVSPTACREAHANHELDFRSDDPLCRLLPGPGRSHEPVVDTVH
jgi:hypothetical protein